MSSCLRRQIGLYVVGSTDHGWHSESYSPMKNAMYRRWDTPKMSLKDPLKVLHIQKVAGIAGSENHLLTLLPRLREYGYAPTMLVLADRNDRPGPFVECMRATGVPIKVRPIMGDLDLLLLPRLVRFMRQGGYDLVHTHLLHADLYGRLAARMAGVSLVSTYHCDDPLHLIPGVR